MKALVCELCGSNDIIKRDGVYICEHCGTKYSVEEARNLFNGTVKIEGEVKVSGLPDVDSLLRRAQDLENQGEHDEAGRLYSRVLEIDSFSEAARDGLARTSAVIDNPNLVVELANNLYASAIVIIDGQIRGKVRMGSPRSFLLGVGEHKLAVRRSALLDLNWLVQKASVNVRDRSYRYRLRVTFTANSISPLGGIKYELFEERQGR